MPIVTKSDKIDLNSEEKTEQLAYKFSKKIKPGDVVFFFGEIGVGKTTFIRYLINNFQRENKLPRTIEDCTFIFEGFELKMISTWIFDEHCRL